MHCLQSIPGFALFPAKPCSPDVIAAAPVAEPVKRLIAAPDAPMSSSKLPTRWSPEQLQHHMCTVGGALQAIRALKDGHQIAGCLLGGSSRPYPANLEQDGALFDDVAVACGAPGDPIACASLFLSPHLFGAQLRPSEMACTSASSSATSAPTARWRHAPPPKVRPVAPLENARWLTVAADRFRTVAVWRWRRVLLLGPHGRRRQSHHAVRL